MRKIFLIPLCLFAGCIACGFNSDLCKAHADVYVATAPDNSVYGLSEQNDMVIPKGYTQTIIKGTIANLPISGDAKLYDFNGAFTLNKDRVQAQQAEQQATIAKQTAMDNAKASAMVKAKALGFTDDELKAVFGQ